MEKKDICMLLRENSYPGRGIIIGLTEDGKRSVMLYFIMGRSENSRNRVFRKTTDGIRTEAFDPAKLADPSLVIYNPVRFYGNSTVVTNGTQTDTIIEYLKSGREFHRALFEWEFEPDPPIFTPRISGMINGDGSYMLSILKSDNGDPECCCRYFYDYNSAIPGLGRFISTYKSDGNPPPSFVGEPIPVIIDASYSLENMANAVWDSLNHDNKVSLYARETIIETGTTADIILNKLH